MGTRILITTALILSGFMVARAEVIQNAFYPIEGKAKVKARVKGISPTGKICRRGTTGVAVGNGVGVGAGFGVGVGDGVGVGSALAVGVGAAVVAPPPQAAAISVTRTNAMRRQCPCS